MNGRQKIVVCPGSFDPVHLGHCDVIERAARIFDKVIVAVSTNQSKKHAIDGRQRVRLVMEATSHLPNVTVEECRLGLIADFCADRNAAAIVKGLRQQQDLAYEIPMAAVNYEMRQVETFFLGARPEYSQISSTVVRELCRFGGDIAPYVPKDLAAAINNLIR